MIRIDAIWLATEPMDMRAGTETALARVITVLGAAKPHCAYLFTNRRANRMKVLVHDGVGIWLAARRRIRASNEMVTPHPARATLSQGVFNSETITMSDLALVGIDLGKHTFHLHGQDKYGRELFRKKLSRQQMMRFFANLSACTVVMEACAGAHFVARELTAMGHQAKLISPQFVKPFVKGNKNDFVDAEAICEAASRPSMRFVSPKTEAQQTLSVLHRLRESLVGERTKAVNQMHGFLLEFGVSLPQGLAMMKRLASVLAEHELPVRLTVLLQRLHDHFV